MWSSRTPQRALQQTPRTKFRAPEPSRSSPAASKDRVSSSRTPRGALKQPPRTESRAPEHLEELSSSLQGTNFKLPSKQARRKKASKAKESKQANNRASKQAIKRANEKTSKRASEQTSKQAHDQTNKQAIKQARGRRGAPKGLQFSALYRVPPPLPTHQFGLPQCRLPTCHHTSLRRLVSGPGSPGTS